MSQSANKGEWSELYAFAYLLKEGRIYAADDQANRLNNMWFPILKILRNETENHMMEYKPGQPIAIFKNGEFIDQVPVEYINQKANELFRKISNERKPAFDIPEMDELLEKMQISQIKSGSHQKADIEMQIHDIQTGFNPIVGFSIKSDVGSPPTLLNAGKNTNIRYEVKGLSDNQIQRINAIDKTVSKEYMKDRIIAIMNEASDVSFDSIPNTIYTDNLILVDSLMPQIYGQLVLMHYFMISEKLYDCEMLTKLLADDNPLGYHNPSAYRHKIKKLLCASALGMTPGKEWDGKDQANGGYIIVKRDGDVICYHIYNRDFFEEYLLKNTQFDRPSASRYNYGNLYKINERTYIDLNVQIRFKSVSKTNDKIKYSNNLSEIMQVKDKLHQMYGI